MYLSIEIGLVGQSYFLWDFPKIAAVCEDVSQSGICRNKCWDGGILLLGSFDHRECSGYVSIFTTTQPKQTNYQIQLLPEKF